MLLELPSGRFPDISLLSLYHTTYILFVKEVYPNLQSYKLEA